MHAPLFSPIHPPCGCNHDTAPPSPPTLWPDCFVSHSPVWIGGFASILSIISARTNQAKVRLEADPGEAYRCCACVLFDSPRTRIHQPHRKPKSQHRRHHRRRRHHRVSLNLNPNQQVWPLHNAFLAQPCHSRRRKAEGDRERRQLDAWMCVLRSPSIITHQHASQGCYTPATPC